MQLPEIPLNPPLRKGKPHAYVELTLKKQSRLTSLFLPLIYQTIVFFKQIASDYERLLNTRGRLTGHY